MNYSWHTFISGCLIPLPAILGNKLILFNFILLIKNIFTGEVKWPGTSTCFTYQLWFSDNNGCLLLKKELVSRNEQDSGQMMTFWWLLSAKKNNKQKNPKEWLHMKKMTHQRTWVWTTPIQYPKNNSYSCLSSCKLKLHIKSACVLELN